MCEERPTFGRRFAKLVELGAIEFWPEPLDAIVERRLKAIWTAASCPNRDGSELRDEDRRVQLDDLLDALALALTAHAPENEFHQLPSDPPVDQAELPIQTVYRRDEPFAV